MAHRHTSLGFFALSALSLLSAACSSEAPSAPVPAAPVPAPTAPVVAPPAPPVAPVAPPAPVVGANVPGTIVLANYRGLGNYYVGIVTAVTGSQLSVLYADGDTETLGSDAVLPDRLMPPLAGEAVVEGTYVPVNIEHRVGHALGVLHTDGRRWWTSVALVRVASATLPAGNYVPSPPAPFGQVGSIVLARYSGDSHWYEAVVGHVIGELRRVVYADGSSEDLPMTALRDGGIAVGARIETRAPQAPEWLPGTVLLRAQHGVQVELASGERRWAAVGLVRVPASANP
ncbi:MAG: hypothetical protein IPG17_26125 [Sandaracinaceae bacterium]|nr:hypothetical protein [Sandaracinaceae bacterium]